MFREKIDSPRLLRNCIYDLDQFNRYLFQLFATPWIGPFELSRARHDLYRICVGAINANFEASPETVRICLPPYYTPPSQGAWMAEQEEKWQKILRDYDYYSWLEMQMHDIDNNDLAFWYLRWMVEVNDCHMQIMCDEKRNGEKT